MSQASDQSSIVLPFPTTRRREFQQPPYPERGELIDGSPNVEKFWKPLPPPEPLHPTPEMGLLIAVLSSLTKAQKVKVKHALFRAAWKNPGDETMRRLHHHIGGLL